MDASCIEVEAGVLLVEAVFVRHIVFPLDTLTAGCVKYASIPSFQLLEKKRNNSPTPFQRNASVAGVFADDPSQPWA